MTFSLPSNSTGASRCPCQNLGAVTEVTPSRKSSNFCKLKTLQGCFIPNGAHDGLCGPLLLGWCVVGVKRGSRHSQHHNRTSFGEMPLQKVLVGLPNVGSCGTRLVLWLLGMLVKKQMQWTWIKWQKSVREICHSHIVVIFERSCCGRRSTPACSCDSISLQIPWIHLMPVHNFADGHSYATTSKTSEYDGMHRILTWCNQHTLTYMIQ